MLEHLDDLESDLSALHRADDMGAMPARRFRVLVPRLIYYEGALRAALTPQEGAGVPSGRAPVPATKLMYDQDPELRGLGTFAEVPRPAVLTPEQQAYVDAHPELQAPPPRS